MEKKMLKKSLIYFLFFIILILMVVFHFSHDPEFTFIHLAIHLPAILGVTSIFFAILIPLLKNRISLTKPSSINSLHHLFSYMGWFSVFAHMVFLYIWLKKYTLYVPSFVSWQAILMKSGPIAVILIILGGIGLFFIKQWRTFQIIHAINILAFIWISVHGIVKDNVLHANIPHFFLLISMDFVIVAILIANACMSKKKVS